MASSKLTKHRNDIQLARNSEDEDQNTSAQSPMNELVIEEDKGYSTVKWGNSNSVGSFSNLKIVDSANRFITLKNGNIKIRKKNKFTTYPKGWLKYKSKSFRYDRAGAKIEAVPVPDNSDDETTQKEFHISFRDQVKKKSLIRVFEVESYKKYNSKSNCPQQMCCTIF